MTATLAFDPKLLPSLYVKLSCGGPPVTFPGGWRVARSRMIVQIFHTKSVILEQLLQPDFSIVKRDLMLLLFLFAQVSPRPLGQMCALCTAGGKSLRTRSRDSHRHVCSGFGFSWRGRFSPERRPCGAVSSWSQSPQRHRSHPGALKLRALAPLGLFWLMLWFPAVMGLTESTL